MVTWDSVQSVLCSTAELVKPLVDTPTVRAAQRSTSGAAFAGEVAKGSPPRCSRAHVWGGTGRPKLRVARSCRCRPPPWRCYLLQLPLFAAAAPANPSRPGFCAAARLSLSPPFVVVLACASSIFAARGSLLDTHTSVPTGWHRSSNALRVASGAGSYLMMTESTGAHNRGVEPNWHHPVVVVPTASSAVGAAAEAGNGAGAHNRRP